MKIPFYISHKRVQAAEFDKATPHALESGILVSFVDIPSITFIDSEWEKVCSRYTPVKGDYVIFYPDGYISVSPRQQFLDGYKPEGESFADIKVGINKRDLPVSNS